MSKGWESKSVEEQQAEAAAPKVKDPALDPELRRVEAERKRRVQALEMQRERVLSERTSSPHRRSALELALAAIEYELEQIGMGIKM